MVRRLVVIAMSLSAAACSLGPPPAPPIAVYDFGIAAPARPAAQVTTRLALDEVGAPSWLQSAAILYRFAYRDGEVHPYSRARWAAPPAALIGQRVRQAFGETNDLGVSAVVDGVVTDFVLRLDLESFTQVVESPSAARAIVRLRARLIATSERRLHAQRIFEAEYPTPSVDAPGAVKALGAATDAVIVQLVEWAARETGPTR